MSKLPGSRWIMAMIVFSFSGAGAAGSAPPPTLSLGAHAVSNTSPIITRDNAVCARRITGFPSRCACKT